MLEVSNITKTYKRRTVLENAGFTLLPGQCLGIAGHNGSGKSTLLSIVAQVTPPGSGTILCDGQNILGNRAFLRKNLGYVPQHNSLLEDLTVLETLRFWQKAYGLPGDALFAPGTPAAALGLQKHAKKRVSTLSGGMQKRLSVALALLHRPRFLLLDEVLSALDRGYRAVLFSLLEDLRAQGTAILYCSHEVGELLSLCDGLLVLREGKPVFYDAASRFPTDPAILDELLNPVAAE